MSSPINNNNNNKKKKKNSPRFLDYRRSPLPLDVALSFSSFSNNIKFDNDNVTVRQLIKAKGVYVNDVIETDCHRLVCRYNDCISVVDEADVPISNSSRCIAKEIAMPRYYICYKPRGVICSTKYNVGIDREDSMLISDWLANISNHRCEQIFNNDTATATSKLSTLAIKTVGRLDEESEGLILLTNDGSFTRLLTDPDFGLKKTYRVVVRGSCYSKIMLNAPTTNNGNEYLADKIADMIHLGNQPPSPATTKDTKKQQQQQFPYESIKVLNAGKIPTQHSSDDSYYAVIDIILREGKRHAVRRIINNATGSIRVCYLSRIAVEGLEGIYDVIKPKSIIDAYELGFLPVDGARHCMDVPQGRMLDHPSDCENDDAGQREYPIILHPGNVIELQKEDVDRIFALRKEYIDH